MANLYWLKNEIFIVHKRKTGQATYVVISKKIVKYYATHFWKLSISKETRHTYKYMLHIILIIDCT